MNLFRKFWISFFALGINAVPFPIDSAFAKDDAVVAGLVAPLCFKPGLKSCDAGITAVCQTTLCIRWYFDPVTETWVKVGKNGWATKIDCDVAERTQYIGPALPVPFARPIVLESGAGRTEITPLGLVICTTKSDCSCADDPIQLGAHCYGAPPVTLQTIDTSQPDVTSPSCTVTIIVING